MKNEEIKNKILMEMNEFITNDILIELKKCLERNLYDVTIIEKSNELTKTNSFSNESLLNKFIFEKKIEGLSDKTLLQYKRETIRFFNMINKCYLDIKQDDITFYLAMLIKKKISMNSVDNSRKFLKPFFKWLYENEYIEKDIFLRIKPIKRINKPKDFLTNNEIVSIRDACDNKRALALVDFLLSTGVRVSECSNLKLKNIDFSTGVVNVYGEKTNEWRKVYLDSNALKHLCDYLNTRNDSNPYVFVNNKMTNGKIERMKNDSIEKLIQKYCKKANINKHCHVHLFRKTLATRLCKRGMSVSAIAKILGHKSSTTTEKYYLTICDQDINYMYQKCI